MGNCHAKLGDRIVWSKHVIRPLCPTQHMYQEVHK
jgi:hypothetical protein